MKNCCLKSLVAYLFVATFSQAEIPVTELSGMTTCMQPGYELYAPALGALYWYSPFVRNLYEYGPDDSAMVQLVKKLFFVHHDNITFDITYSPTKVARYCKPEHIGKILGYIELYAHDPEALKANLHRTSSSTIQRSDLVVKIVIKYTPDFAFQGF